MPSLRVVPATIHLPVDDHEIEPYRFVLEHGDYGIDSMAIIPDSPKGDREIAHVIPALLSDPEVAVTVDLGVDLYSVPLV